MVVVVMIIAMTRPLRIMLASGLVLAGCSASGRALRTAPPALLADPKPVSEWEGLARPDALSWIATLIALLGASSGDEDDCPKVERDSAFTLLRGDCIDSQGVRHHGWARITMLDDSVRVRLHDFGKADGRASGRVKLWTEPHERFAMDLRFEPGLRDDDTSPPPAWTVLDVEGHLDPSGAWHGEGRLASANRGRVRMEAHDIELGDRCTHEPLRGSLELWADEQHVRIDYDGATDCDPEGTAQWSLGGVAMGELSGIEGELGCEADEHNEAIPPSGAMLLLLGIRRRRRRRRDQPARAPE